MVGRTGAGKSSVLAALLRMCHVEGEIILDGVDILKDVPLSRARSVVSVIPQDPILFSGSLRSNLDPFNMYTDDEIWMSLHKVQLSCKISLKNQQLHSRIVELGRNYSLGERQLICLARALLKKSHLLVIDEATANVDNETDKHIQEILKQHFQHCTMITIAHRLNTIMNSDRIVLMESGRIMECGNISELLKAKGYFFQLVTHPF